MRGEVWQATRLAPAHRPALLHGCRSYEVFALLVALYALVQGPFRQWRATVIYFYAAITPILIGLTNEWVQRAAARAAHAACSRAASCIWTHAGTTACNTPLAVITPVAPPAPRTAQRAYFWRHDAPPHHANPVPCCSVLVAKAQLPGSNGSDTRANAVAAGLILVLIGNGVQVGRDVPGSSGRVICF